MNAAHFHLAVNHLPIIFPFAGIIILVLGIIIKSDIVKRTAYFLFILGAIFTVFALISGEKAYEFISGFDWASAERVEKHESTAKLFGFSNFALGALSAFGMWANWKGKSYAKIVLIVIVLFSIVVLFFAQATGTAGGEIRHTEIRKE